MSVAASIDSAKQEAFVGQVLANTSAAMVTTLAALGDRLGLFKTWRRTVRRPAPKSPPAPGIVERYAREWLGGMTSGGYRRVRPRDDGVRIAARARGGARRRGRARCSSAAASEMLFSASSVVDRVAEAFRPVAASSSRSTTDDIWDGMSASRAAGSTTSSCSEWVPAVPGRPGASSRRRVRRRCRHRSRAGADPAGAGVPEGHFVGYDAFEPTHRAGDGERERGRGRRPDAASRHATWRRRLPEQLRRDHHLRRRARRRRPAGPAAIDPRAR